MNFIEQSNRSRKEEMLRSELTKNLQPKSLVSSSTIIIVINDEVENLLLGLGTAQGNDSVKIKERGKQLNVVLDKYINNNDLEWIYNSDDDKSAESFKSKAMRIKQKISQINKIIQAMV